MLGVAGAIVGVLAVIDGARIFGYVHNTLAGGSSGRWRTTDSMWERIVYHISGPGGRLMLGRQVWVLGALVVAAIGVAWAGGRRRERVVLMSMGLPMVAALAVVSAVPMRIAQFGACFQAGLALMAVVGLGYMARRMGIATGRRWVGTAMVWGVSAVMLVNARWTFPRAVTEAQRARVVEEREVAERVYAAAVEARGNGGSGAIVFGGDPGDVCPELFRLWSVRDGVRLRFGRVADIGTGVTDPGVLGMTGDVLIVSDGCTGMTAQKRGTAGADARIVAAVESLPGWSIVARMPGPHGKGEFVVARRDAE